MKKVTALLLAIVMVLGLGTMASASAPADRVQINNMMVDASLVETQNEEVAELEMVVPESSIATTAFLRVSGILSLSTHSRFSLPLMVSYSLYSSESDSLA